MNRFVIKKSTRQQAQIIQLSHHWRRLEVARGIARLENHRTGVAAYHQERRRSSKPVRVIPYAEALQRLLAR